MHPSLIKLSFRRSLWPALLIGGLALLWILWSAHAGEASALASRSRAPGVLRYSVWMTGLLVVGPLLIASAARAGHRLARRDAAWCASRPASRLSLFTSSWAGASLAACAWLLLVAFTAELSAGEHEARALQPVGSATLAPIESERAGVVAWQLDADAAGGADVLRVPVGLITVDGPAATVRVRLARVTGDSLTERELQIATRRPIEVDVPGGSGPLTLELERLGAGALVLVPSKRAEWWRVAEGPAEASLLLSYQFGLLACAVLAWAMCLGVWLRPATATALTLSVLLALWVSESAVGGWGALMEHIANGDLPGSPTLLGGAACLTAWATGTFAGWWGLRRGARA
ncbi:MAG: hypothetical protein MK291_04185 [Planctomycetes bacterium]|nr:hypothetical protein [Planctomycetota bacterium]